MVCQYIVENIREKCYDLENETDEYVMSFNTRIFKKANCVVITSIVCDTGKETPCVVHKVNNFIDKKSKVIVCEEKDRSEIISVTDQDGHHCNIASGIQYIEKAMKDKKTRLYETITIYVFRRSKHTRYNE